MTTSALELNRLLSQSIGDWIAVQTTTMLINTNATIMSTNLWQYDSSRDDYFRDWWATITDKNNAGADRKVKNYYTANGGIVCYGANFALDTVQANIRVHRYSYSDKQMAINSAIKEVYPTLYRDVDDRASITTNSLLYEYALPSALQTGSLKQVLINAAGTTSEATWDRIVGWDIVNAGAYIRFPATYTSGHIIRLIGIAPLETVVNTTDVVNIDAPRTDLLIAYAKYKLYQGIEGYPASEDTGRYESASMKAYREYLLMKPRLQMMPPLSTMNMVTY